MPRPCDCMPRPFSLMPRLCAGLVGVGVLIEGLVAAGVDKDGVVLDCAAALGLALSIRPAPKDCEGLKSLAFWAMVAFWTLA